jgi:hypothetical protein
MADKLTKEDVSARIVGHLQVYAEKVAEVVDDFKNMEREREMPQAGKQAFAQACMQDIEKLTMFLAKIINETAEQVGLEVDDLPKIATEADIIDLEQYRANGGLIN